MPVPVPVAVALTDDERAQLERWARRLTSAQALALRSRIVLLADEGHNNTREPVAKCVDAGAQEIRLAVQRRDCGKSGSSDCNGKRH